MTLLHIHNGDAAAAIARKSTLAGEHFAWRESLISGPTPAGLSTAQWRLVRAQHLAQSYGVDEAECESSLRKQEAMLASASEYTEVVLWFEHDLFCQLHLLYLLDWFSRYVPGETTLSLICIGEFPGKANFRGLGELSPAELASLFPARTKVTPAQLTLAATAWQAYCDAEPFALKGLLAADTSPLPFLRPALAAHLARFPATRNGLGHVENRALQLVAEGINSFAELFARVSNSEAIYGFGDAQFWLALSRLITAPTPLLTISGLASGNALTAVVTRELIEHARLAVTDAGHSVRTGAIDFVALNGSDQWLGGVHLRDPRRLWRWHEASQTLVVDSRD
jgi:hypothetical protein